MKDKFIDELFAAADKMFKTMGHAKFEDGVAEVADFVVQIAEVMTIMKDRKATRRWLQSLPDPEPSEFAQSLQQLPNFPYLIRRLAPNAVKVLPHAPGGRPVAITPQKRRQICKEIADLYLKGTPLGIAQRRLAQRYHVNVRTVQRIWHNREKG
jgi:hypothetical protein